MPFTPPRAPRLDIASAIGLAWRDVPAVALGDIRDSIMIEREFVLLRDGEQPLLRLDIHLPRDEYHLHTEADIWGEWIIVGFAARVEMLSLVDHRRRVIALSDAGTTDSLDYFCKIACYDEALLVSSGRRVFRISANGEILWKSPEVGLDGVIVSRLDGEVVHGSGEWDPPGGWIDFRLSLRTGQMIED